MADELNWVPTSVRLPKGILKWARQRAFANGQNFSSFVRVTLEALKHQEEQATRRAKIKQLER